MGSERGGASNPFWIKTKPAEATRKNKPQHVQPLPEMRNNGSRHPMATG